MKEYERSFDDIGRMNIPAELRKKLGWTPDDILIFSEKDGEVRIRRKGDENSYEGDVRK